MVFFLLVIAGIAFVTPLIIYGRWTGWGFGLGWWGTPTPARVLEVRPLDGAQLSGHSEQSLVENAHRVSVDLEVQPHDGEPYRATTIAWQRSGEGLGGRTVVARVSRTRPERVFVPKGAADAPEGDGTY